MEKPIKTSSIFEWRNSQQADPLPLVEDPIKKEKARRFYMLLTNGWRQMTQQERNLIGNECAKLFQYLCPVGWDAKAGDALNKLKVAEQEELVRDRIRIEKDGGKWIDLN